MPSAGPTSAELPVAVAKLQIDPPDAGNAAGCTCDLHIQPGLLQPWCEVQGRPGRSFLERVGATCLPWENKRWILVLVRILLAIVHYWNPEGGGAHGSLRPDPRPRIEAFQQQLLALQRLGIRQAELNMASMSADSANRQLQHQIDIKVITDGEHHVLDRLDPPYRGLFQMVITQPFKPKHLGFEAQRFLASRLDESYDLYGYFEDDLIIHDPWFFRKIDWFRSHVGDDCLLLPHRVEFARDPSEVDRFFIDGPMEESDLRYVIPEPGPSLAAPCPGGSDLF